MKSEYLKQSRTNRLQSEKEKDFSEESEQVVSSVRPSEVTISNRNAPLDVFFKRKEAEIQKKESTFNKILDSKEFQQLSSDNNFSKSVSKFSRFSKSSIKRKEEKELQLKGIVDEHKKMLSKLQTKMKSEEELNEFEKNLLKEEKNRYLSKIEELESEIEQLYRDNYRLKEMEKAKPTESFNMGDLNEKSKEESMHKPYVIKTLNNDLNRINFKNYERSKEKQQRKDKEKEKEKPKEDVLGSKLERERPITAQQFFNKKPNHFGLYEQKFPSKKLDMSGDQYILHELLGPDFHDNHNNKPAHPLSQGKQKVNSFLNQSNYSSQLHSSFQQENAKNSSVSSINQGNHFDTFQMANTLSYVNDSAINESRQMVHMSSQVSTRNKVAFFKQSLVLIREPDIEIAFKRSGMNDKLNKLRIIFYVNNKVSSQRSINFSYQYQAEYFTLNVLEKLTALNGQAQGREVVEIELISKTDLNGVTDLHVQVDGKVYDLWLPATFIRFKRADAYKMQNDEVEMCILPDRQFSSCSALSELVPVMYGGKDSSEEWAYLYGESQFGSFPVKLTWREKELIVEATEKWTDFLGFVFHFFK